MPAEEQRPGPGQSEDDPPRAAGITPPWPFPMTRPGFAPRRPEHRARPKGPTAPRGPRAPACAGAWPPLRGPRTLTVVVVVGLLLPVSAAAVPGVGRRARGPGVVVRVAAGFPPESRASWACRDRVRGRKGSPGAAGPSRIQAGLAAPEPNSRNNEDELKTPYQHSRCLKSLSPLGACI